MKRLIAGERRIAAFRMLGRDEIPATVARNLDEAITLLRAEHDENVCRKDFTPTEAVSIGADIEEIEGPLKEKARKEGKDASGRAGGRGRKKNLEVSSLKVKRAPQTGDIAAAAAGVSRRTYEKAKEVVASKVSR